MFNSGILDVVIGVVVIYLQLSLVCTAINELVALWLQKRAKELEKGIRGLLASKELGDKFYEHPLIKALRPDKRKPSYIPARTFSLALMDIVRRAAFDGTATVTAAAQAVADKETAQAAAQTTLDAAKKAFDDAATIRTAADAAVETAGTADKATALQIAQDAASKQAAAEAQVASAQARLDAATKEKTGAETYLTQVTNDVNAARDTEAAAKTAEASAAANPKDTELQKAAVTARNTANEAADKLAPTAASLLTEARAKVAAAPGSVVPPQLKVSLLALMDNAGTNLTKAQANVEQWFDDAMDRVSGVYKRKSHVFVVTIAVLVTVFANVDTLQVADSLSHDKAVRDSLVAAAPELAKKGQPTPSPTPASTPPPAGTPPAGGAAGGSGANPPAAPAISPEPTIGSIKASLDELNKLSLPIGYIRVCTAGEEKAAGNCAAVHEARALVNDTEAKLKKAVANSQKAASDLKTAQENQQKASDDNLKAPEDKKAGTQAALAQAQAELGKAQAAQANAVVELNKAKAARESAGAARPAELKKVEDELKVAEEAATASPTDENKKLAAEAARHKVELFPTDCPTCRKASELTEDQLTRRLPTTHDHSLMSIEGLGALVGDILNLLYAHWLGWLLTAMAVSLGAPFWFDMLNKLIVVRSTVKPHEKSKEQESKDNPDEKDETKKT